MGTYWTPASTAQKRSSNYDQQETVGNTTNLATKVVNVMKELNVGPTAAGISVIKDAILTVYSQATLRYTAKLTLGAHLPGNGMGGSTKPTEIINPAISTVNVALAKTAYDYVAGAYFGCGENNPVALPT